MKNTDPISIVTGILFVVVGVILLFVSLLIWPLMIYAVIILVIGIVILSTCKKQEQIEQIKSYKKKKN